MRPTCRVTGRPLRDIDPDALVERHLFGGEGLPDPDQYHCLANSVLVSAITAKSIRAHRSPDQYLHKISAQMPDLLRQQQITDDATDLVSALQQGRRPSP